MSKVLVAFVTFLYSSFTLAVTCQEIAHVESTDGGVFSLASYNNHLYVGMFGYNYNVTTKDDVMLYRLEDDALKPSNLTKDKIGTSESICAMREFNGYLYAATESSGDIFRSANGLSWNLVYNGEHRDACDLHAFGGVLIAPQTHGGVVLKTTNGTDWDSSTVTTSGDPYIRESVYYKGYWYVFGIKRSDYSRFGYRSSDLVTWSSIPVPGRVFRTTIIGNVLWASIAASPPYGSQNRIGIYSTTNGTTWTKRYLSGYSTYSHLNTLYKVRLDDNRDALIATTSTGFKPRSNGDTFGKEGSGALHEFRLDGAYVKKLCSFTNQEYAESTLFHNGSFYIGTMHGGYHIADSAHVSGYGKLYRVSGVVEVKNINIVPIISLLLLDDS